MPINSNSAVVYLVDDEVSVCDSVSIFLQSTGRQVKCYGSARQFLQEYVPTGPGCLILDIRMPDMDGLELQRELVNKNIQIPIIFISGHADISDAAKAFRAGAFDFMEKPYDNNELLKRIDEALIKDKANRLQQ